MNKEDVILELFKSYVSKEPLNEEKSVDYESLVITHPKTSFEIDTNKAQSIIKRLSIDAVPDEVSDDQRRAFIVLRKWCSRVSELNDLLKVDKIHISKLGPSRTSEIIKMIMVTSLAAKIVKFRKGIVVSAFEIKKGSSIKNQYGEDYLTRFKIEFK